MAKTKKQDNRTSFELTFTFDNNQVVRVKVDYEVDNALSAINALTQAADGAQALTYTFKDDPSVRAALEAAHLGFIDEDEEY